MKESLSNPHAKESQPSSDEPSSDAGAKESKACVKESRSKDDDAQDSPIEEISSVPYAVLSSDSSLDSVSCSGLSRDQIPLNPRAALIARAQKFRKGACINCGSTTHNRKYCLERPRLVTARYRESIPMECAESERSKQSDVLGSYAEKRDPWKNHNFNRYQKVREEAYERREEARMNFLKKKAAGSEKDFDEVFQMPPAKKAFKFSCSSRVREDTAKYLMNLNPNSSFYDPKSRSMREDPLPHLDAKEKLYFGDNHATGRVPTSKYVEDHYINNHTSVWGSWWSNFDRVGVCMLSLNHSR